MSVGELSRKGVGGGGGMEEDSVPGRVCGRGGMTAMCAGMKLAQSVGMPIPRLT